MNIKCDNCKKYFKITQYQFKTEKHHFCNRKCYGAWRSKYLVGKKCSSYKIKINDFCDNCGKKIKIYPYQVNDNKKHFCKNNGKCWNEWQSKHMCGKRHHSFKEKNNVRCSNCNKMLHISNWRVKRNLHTFCNRKCQDRFFIGKNSYNYIHGKSRLPYPMEFNESLKEFIRKRDGYKCINCGIPQKEIYRKLDVHHIDYNKNNIDTINLISLCYKCNLKANFNHQYWQNYYGQMQINRRVHLLDMKLEMEERIEW